MQIDGMLTLINAILTQFQVASTEIVEKVRKLLTDAGVIESSGVRPRLPDLPSKPLGMLSQKVISTPL